MSGQWLQALLILVPTLALICLVLERLSFGRIANIVTFGVLAVGALTLAALSTDYDRQPIASRPGGSRGAPLDIRMEARRPTAATDAERRTVERVIAAPTAAPVVQVQPSPPPLVETARPIAPVAPSPTALQCPALPSSDEIEQRCASKVAAETAALRDEQKAVIERLQREAELARGETAALGEVVRQREAEIAGTRADAERHRQALEAAKAELAMAELAKAELAKAKVPLPQAAATPQPVPASPVVPQAKEAPPAQPSPAATSAPLKDKLEQGITVASYALQPLPATELVQGRRGRYYTVSLRNPTDGKPILFEPGSYDLAGRVSQIEAAARRLRSDVLAAIPPKVTRQIYVQAFATSSRFARARNLPAGDADLSKVLVHRRLDPDQFGPTPVAAAITGTYQNSDLPVLRAASVAAPLSTALGAPVVVLDGGINSAADKQSALAIELVLFIDW